MLFSCFVTAVLARAIAHVRLVRGVAGWEPLVLARLGVLHVHHVLGLHGCGGLQQSAGVCYTEWRNMLTKLDAVRCVFDASPAVSPQDRATAATAGRYHCALRIHVGVARGLRCSDQLCAYSHALLLCFLVV